MSSLCSSSVYSHSKTLRLIRSKVALEAWNSDFASFRRRSASCNTWASQSSTCFNASFSAAKHMSRFSSSFRNFSLLAKWSFSGAVMLKSMLRLNRATALCGASWRAMFCAASRSRHPSVTRMRSCASLSCSAKPSDRLCTPVASSWMPRTKVSKLEFTSCNDLSKSLNWATMPWKTGSGVSRCSHCSSGRRAMARPPEPKT
mmetsp:Transcript_13495/g.32032  ORF Transcript_13495/g.32032 Transcript_13495/m.32032 type:complete len:202 (-) Transcript_13495:2-607(-)